MNYKLVSGKELSSGDWSVSNPRVPAANTNVPQYLKYSLRNESVRQDGNWSITNNNNVIALSTAVSPKLNFSKLSGKPIKLYNWTSTVTGTINAPTLDLHHNMNHPIGDASGIHHYYGDLNFTSPKDQFFIGGYRAGVLMQV